MKDVAMAVLRRDWAIERTYPVSLITVFTEVIGIAVGLFFVSQLVEPDAIAQYDGTYFDFAMIGLAVAYFAGTGLESFSSALLREQSTGTLELLLVSPASITSVSIGMLLLPTLVSTVQIALVVAIGIGIVGSGIPIGGLLVAIPILLLTTLTFAAIGFAVAGLLLLVKRGDPISAIFYQGSLLLSGAIFPVELLPRPLEILSALLPLTYATRALREILLNHASLVDVLPDVLILCGFAVVLLPLGLKVFDLALATARRQGGLGAY